MTSTAIFSDSRSLEQPGLIIETLKYQQGSVHWSRLLVVKAMRQNDSSRLRTPRRVVVWRTKWVETSFVGVGICHVMVSNDHWSPWISKKASWLFLWRRFPSRTLEKNIQFSIKNYSKSFCLSTFKTCMILQF